ncbi:hypothetical protein HGA64_00395 [Candidatus Falkowbacteria bacterium]|nr:hypothetical protein [Candidatus Falkowbacteria bacterium]
MSKKTLEKSKIISKKRPKVALVLGGGGARGLAHIGVLKALEAAEIRFDVIFGTSMGALIGSCYAIGYDLDKLEIEAKSFNKRKAIKELVDLTLPRQSLIRGKKAHRYIDRLIKNAHFGDANIPVHVIATDLADGQPVVMSRGDMSDAIQASIAVPGVFPPVKVGGRYLIDGGVASPTPIAEALAWGADIVVAVDLVLKRGSKLKEKPGLIFTLMQSYEIIRNKSVWDGQTEHQRVIMVKPDLNGNGVVSSFKFFNAQGFIAAGVKATQAVIPQIREAIDNF